MPTNRKNTLPRQMKQKKWYFDWLQKQINSCEDSLYTVTILSKVEQSPKKYSKTVTSFSETLQYYFQYFRYNHY